MIKALSLVAALALLPLSSALAQESVGPDHGAAEAALEAAAEAFEAHMETFAERAEAIQEDESLDDAAKEAAVMALWAEYEPAVTEFTSFATQQAGLIASEAMAGIDIEALVAEAMNDPEVQAAMAAGVQTGMGIAANGAWSSTDPEHLATYGLMADYAIGEAEDAMDEAMVEMDAARAEAGSPDRD
jgi:hypothetical protein